MSVKEVLSRLARRTDVDGVALLGSGTSELGPASDYDVLVVLATREPIPDLALTEIDGRLADVLFVATHAIEAALSGTAVAGPWNRGRLLAWLRQARIELDRSGRLHKLQDTARKVVDRAEPADFEKLWFRLNYDVKHTRRLLKSDDPVYQTAVDLRLLFGLDQTLNWYFAIRMLPWHGQKEAVKYLMAHDPDFLDLLRKCLAETDRSKKVALYEQLVAKAVAPLGGRWPDGFTGVQVPQGTSVEEGLAVWARLVGE